MKKVIYLWIIISSVLAVSFAKDIYNGTDEKYPLYKDLELLADVLTIVQKGYVTELSPEELVHKAARGMVNSLDSHSQFLEEEEYKDMKIETEGEFGGLGIEISVRDGSLTIVAPLEDTPADKAGLKPGDRIIKIDGENTENLTLTDAVKKLRGDPGTTVNLVIFRADRKEFMDFSIARSVIKIESVKDVKILDEGILYIRITQFQEHTSEDVRKYLTKLADENTKGIIVDLRNNPGGVLQEAVNVAGIFIEEPKLIVSTKGRLPDQNQEFLSTNKMAVIDIPLAILINKGSASGSEIIAGAVKDWKRGILIGTKTFGKGSVQSVLPLRDGSALKLTTAKYFTPNGTNINDIGIEPDIEIPLSPEQEEHLWQIKRDTEKRKELPDISSDPQLQRAMDVLRGIKIFKEATTPETSPSSPEPVLP